MAETTVSQSVRNHSTEKVKNPKGFWHWSRRAAAPQHAAGPEPSHYPRPDADTQILPPVAGGEPAPTHQLKRVPPQPPRVHRSPETDPGDLAIDIAGIALVAAKNRWSSTVFWHELEGNIETLRRRAQAEKDSVETIARRSEAAAKAAVKAAHDIEAAVAAEEASKRVPGLTVAVDLDTQALGKGVAALTANATALAEQTMTFQAITEDTPDPRAAQPVELEMKESGPGGVVLTVTSGAPSPVHHDGTTPPVPDDEDADPGDRSLTTLPRRIPYGESGQITARVPAHALAKGDRIRFAGAWRTVDATEWHADTDTVVLTLDGERSEVADSYMIETQPADLDLGDEAAVAPGPEEVAP